MSYQKSRKAPEKFFLSRKSEPSPRLLKTRSKTDQSVEVAFVDQGYTGDEPAEAAQAEGMRLEVIKLPEAKKGFVLLPRR